MQNFNEFQEKLGQRLDKIEDSLILAHDKIDKLHNFLKLIEEVGDKMNNSFDRIKTVKDVLNSHENAISKIERVLNDYEENGIASNKKDDSEKINYDILVKKLTKANIDIVKYEVEFALKNKK